ncbi:hypothetical protein Hamer_G010304 [Homarus americanus]|uniref:Uncharacterized protein n=1 Tax=Homarus americanus TaxID=6706 RepID=A0A8J5K3D8_HOMAM|nr:hypothetical protein Hamer_G010304 [Homarus americanus]
MMGIQIHQDFDIMARLPPGGDLTAADAFYNFQCLTTINNRLRSKRREATRKPKDQCREAWFHALVEFYGEISWEVGEGKLSFRLRDLEERLSETLKKRGC